MRQVITKETADQIIKSDYGLESLAYCVKHQDNFPTDVDSAFIFLRRIVGSAVNRCALYEEEVLAIQKCISAAQKIIKMADKAYEKKWFQIEPERSQAHDGHV